MIKNPSLNSQAKAIFIGSLAGIIFQFLIPVILVRLISKENFGVFRQFQLVSSTFLGFLGMGYQTSLFYFYPIANDKGRKKIIQQTQFLFIINYLIFIVFFFFFGDQILTYLNFTQFVDMKFYLISYIMFMLLSMGVSNIFTLEKDTILNKLYPSVDNIVRFFIFLITILIIPGVKGPIIALMIYSFIRLVYYLSHIKPYLIPIYKIDFDLLRKQLFYSIPFGFALILNMISTKFDKFFINQYITSEEFGVYSIAFLGIPILGQFFKSIHNVVVPQISIYLNEGDMNKASNLWKKTVDKTSNVTIPAVILFWILSEEIITILYTIDYIEAANYYRIFILTFFISMLSYNIILRGANKTKYILFSDIIGVLITIAIGFFLIPKIGLYGAVITAVIGRILPMLISLIIERKIMGLSYENWFNWKNMGINFLISFLVAIPLFIFKDYINNIYFRSILTILIFFVTVILLQIKFNLFLFSQYIPKIKNFLRL